MWNLNLTFVVLGWITSVYLVYRLAKVMDERPDQRLNRPCPWCGGGHAYTYETKVLGSIASMGNYCTECEAEWRGIYKIEKEVRV